MIQGVDSKHPEWGERQSEWKLARDAVRGEVAIKAAGETYLPMPSGFRAAADTAAAYGRYKERAEVPEIMSPTIGGMVGVIHRTEAKIEMPDALTPIWERATADGLPLEAFHRRITSELLTTGRYGVLADAPPQGGDVPHLAGYSAESLINWGEDRSFFVLDESGYERSGFTWKWVKRFRVLELSEGRYVQRVFVDGESAPKEIQPLARGGRAIEAIPFVVIGPRDLSIAPQDPPLMGVARAVKASYQLSADYRWQLFMTGQETLFVINGNAPDAVGAGVVVTLNGSEGMQPDAKYVGPAGTGIEAHRQALHDKAEQAVAAGARMFQSGDTTGQESGAARRMRYAAQTATLTTVAQSSAQGLEAALRHAAQMMGLDPQGVTVTPNLDFLDEAMSPADAEALVRVWQSGAISYETLHANLQRGEIISADVDADGEMKRIDDEQPDGPPDLSALTRPATTPV